MPPMLGKLFIVLTWALLLLSNYITVIILLGRWFSVTRTFTSSCNYFYCSYTLTGRLFFISYEFLIILTLICHLRAVFGDPGKTKSIVPATPPPGFTSPHFCNLCGSRWKPPRAHHCRKCQTCVFRMDHHCTWIDNCVGITNQKFFILFLVYTAFLCFYQLFLLFLAFLSWIWYRPFTYCFSSTAYLIILSLESLVFLYITTDFLCEQIESLETNSTLVESHQHTHGVRKSLSVTLFEVFGERSLFWCLPTYPKLQVDYSEPIFLTKSAALQLRLKKHRQLNRKKRVMEGDPSRNLLIPSSHIKSIKGENHHYLLDSSADPNIPTTEEHKSPLGTTVSYRGGSAEKQDASNTVYQDFLHCDQLYRNKHIKPSSDIGVHIDDDSDFISLDSLQSDEYTTTEQSLN